MFPFVLIFSALLFVSNPLSACEKTVRVIEFPPYAYKNGDAWEGMNMALSEKLLESIGCRPSYVSLPLARALSLLKSGALDVVLQLTATEERKSYFRFIGPIYNERLVLATNEKMRHTIREVSDIVEYNLHIGVQRGLHMGRDFQERYDNDPKFRASFVVLAGVAPLLPMMKKRRLDGFFIDELHFDYMKKSNPDFSGLSKQPFIVHQSAVYAGLSKKSFSTSDANKIQTQFNRLKKGTLEAISNRHLAN